MGTDWRNVVVSTTPEVIDVADFAELLDQAEGNGRVYVYDPAAEDPQLVEAGAMVTADGSVIVLPLDLIDRVADRLRGSIDVD